MCRFVEIWMMPNGETKSSLRIKIKSSDAEFIFMKEMSHRRECNDVKSPIVPRMIRSHENTTMINDELT